MAGLVDLDKLDALLNSLPAMIAELRGLRGAYANLLEVTCPLCGGWPGEADGSCAHCVGMLNAMSPAMGFYATRGD